MNSLFVHFFFYIFLSGAILFTILGVFSGMGNPALIIDNYQLDQNNKPIEEPGIKKRVTLQYFIAAFLDLCFSLIFLKFIFSQNSSSKMKIEIITKKNNEINNNNINNDIIIPPEINEKEKEKNENINTNANINSINEDVIDTNNNQGMSEKNI